MLVADRMQKLCDEKGRKLHPHEFLEIWMDYMDPTTMKQRRTMIKMKEAVRREREALG